MNMEFGDENTCPKAPDGKHESDIATITYVDSDIVDVNCKHCGRSGSFVLIIDEDDVNW